MDLTFSSESKNSQMYFYFQDIIGGDLDLPFSGESNIFIDLLNSFAFWDEDLRKKSGFKIKSMKVTLSHDLHDFDLDSTITIKPRLTTDTSGKKYYDFTPYFTFSVSWRPMSSLKTSIVDEYGEWQLNP